MKNIRILVQLRTKQEDVVYSNISTVPYSGSMVLPLLSTEEGTIALSDYPCKYLANEIGKIYEKHFKDIFMKFRRDGENTSLNYYILVITDDGKKKELSRVSKAIFLPPRNNSDSYDQENESII